MDTPNTNTAKLPNSHGGRSFRWVAAILGILVIGLITWVIWMTIGGRGVINPTAKSPSVTPSSAVAASAIVESPCYKLTVPRAINKGLDFGCEVNFSYAEGDQNTFTISGQPLPIKADTTLNEPAGYASYKAALVSSGTQILSEETVQLGGSPARKLITQPASKGQALSYFVVNRNPNVTNTKGVLTTALVVTAPYFTPEQTQVVNAILASWQWKTE